eukprot:Awhi_evm1s15679
MQFHKSQTYFLKSQYLAPRSQISFVACAANKITTQSKLNQQVLENARNSENLSPIPARPCMTCERLSQEIKALKESLRGQMKNHQIQNHAIS